MKFSGKHLVSPFLMAIAVGVIVTAIKWPFKTALFPTIVSLFIFFGAMAEFLLNFHEGEQMSMKEDSVDFQLSEDVDPALASRRTLLGFGWIIGFFLLILLFGFLLAIPLMVFLFLKVQSKEGWGISLGLTALALVFFYGLFIWLLNIPFPRGWFWQFFS
ncbi:MAG: tripartite tricarboxylate transporter TctB family protein [Thermodesulfobacteriota bacterium]